VLHIEKKKGTTFVELAVHKNVSNAFVKKWDGRCKINGTPCVIQTSDFTNFFGKSAGTKVL
jgi:hypothetical protein